MYVILLGCGNEFLKIIFFLVVFSVNSSNDGDDNI